MESRVEQLVSSLHGVTDKAVCVGFGVSGPSQVNAVVHAPRCMAPPVGSLLSKRVGSSNRPHGHIRSGSA